MINVINYNSLWWLGSIFIRKIKKLKEEFYKEYEKYNLKHEKISTLFNCCILEDLQEYEIDTDKLLKDIENKSNDNDTINKRSSKDKSSNSSYNDDEIEKDGDSNKVRKRKFNRPSL